MKKSVTYYMGLPYTVELKRGGEGYRASIKELPECTATVPASESVEKLWQRLEDAQREWIEQELEMGREVPETPGASRDPFWDEFEEGNPNYDEWEVRSALNEYGATGFPFRVLEELWLQELKDVGLSEVKPSTSVPPKAEINYGDQTTPWLRGDVRPVRLGKSLKGAWLRLDGPRTKHGYRNIEVLDKPLRTEAAIVAALTVLEASKIESFDFERLREALLEHVKTTPELSEKNLEEVLDELPNQWLWSQKAEIDRELKQLDERLKYLNRKERKEELAPEEERERNKLKKHLPEASWRWARHPFLWKRSIRYMLALFRYRRLDLEGYTLREQFYILDNQRKHINEFLEAQRDHMAFLEYGTPTGITTRVVELARDQVRAAVLRDVEKCTDMEIASILGEDIDEDKYKVEAKIPKIQKWIKEGRDLLKEILADESGWQKRAEEMKADADWYNSLSEEEKLIEREAEIRGRTVEEVRSYYQRTGARPSGFMAIDALDRRPQP